jgi:hypothetical protein
LPALQIWNPFQLARATEDCAEEQPHTRYESGTVHPQTPGFALSLSNFFAIFAAIPDFVFPLCHARICKKSSVYVA